LIEPLGAPFGPTVHLKKFAKPTDGDVERQRPGRDCIDDFLSIGACALHEAVEPCGVEPDPEVAGPEVGHAIDKPEVPSLRHAAIEVDIGVDHAFDPARRGQTGSGEQANVVGCRRLADDIWVGAACQTAKQVECNSVVIAEGADEAGLLDPPIVCRKRQAGQEPRL
jgi:hypothetical protein